MINNKIKEIRTVRKITEKELAEMVGMSLTGFRQAMEKDDFKASTLKLLSKVLNVPIGYFFEEMPAVGYTHGIQQVANGNGNNQVVNLSHEIDVLKKEIEGLKKELAAKNDLIDVLRGLRG